MNRSERNRLVVDNLPLVGYLVSEVWAKARHLSRDDLASAGSLALITSADAFDPDLGVPFGAFARRRIIGAFADEMRSNDWATRMARRRIKDTRQVQETLASALGRSATVDEIASALGVDRETALAGLADSERTLSTLDDSTAEFLVADTVLPEESLLSAERLAYLRAGVSALPERMRLIIEQVYFEDRSVKEIAASLGITHSAVSQQRSEAIRLLRDGLGTHYADDAEADFVPESTVAPARRSAYLSRMADQAMLGMAHLAHDRMPAAVPVLSAAPAAPMAYTVDGLAGVTDIAHAEAVTLDSRELFSSNG
ncbi:flagellar biosynthesis protein FliA [Cryobacterium sp. LW097]|uniref:sigma-70 family RNA polymerase sigma factor n=1 Tax=unclassified Cryobacterium TaxID=2649013 RepID=UPI000B4C4827|nr:MULTISPECIES: sigma-70 family RNA polymerase sigma factor [unclassified Cryobacterium]ASD21919.1 flagellar biosynthesis protein FliA [Cryobacterium sp. LW097]TFC53505.1 sigma-70 family RNA polymerase sigma factor [Cryobacterium sp. TMB3-1-2]TFC69171.1 sigma-70 family RNA polymerase sigma factor [Cryobacterium sp. TMB3-15]TFC76031.1 sigma-70 family RNA polymerase sigma factor [Cryobacterium sp. TMB3-10]TFC87044.1 sigma-70 family RNA polymerase sigma factor [Cryobacterium sp. TMT4-31]